MIKHLQKLKRYFPSKNERFWKRLLFWAFAGGISLFLFAMISFVGLITILSIGLPDVTDLENLSAAQSTQIFDREGNLLYTIHGEENREQIEFKEISEDLINATIAIEDDVFWEHGGFDIWAIGRAGLYSVFGIGTPRGGSTITQQYVKNTFLSPERSYIRKAKEVILAIRLEKAYTKEEIIALYLNRIPYGNNAYGCEKAAEIYFDSTCKELTLAQSAILASLPQAPSRYNPYGNYKYSVLLKEFSEDELYYRNIEDESDLEIEEYARGLIGRHVDLGNGEKIYIQGRSDLVLRRMFELGDITADERQAALNELQTTEFNNYREPIKHPHFTLYIKQILEDRYGKDVVEQGGLKVYTTIDPELQEHAEEVAFKYGESNEANYNANNIAILSVNAKDGQILAMVGSRDYFNEDIDGNVNVVLRPRQPGSSFKPIAYAQAFYNGYAPGNVIYDIPTKIGANQPQNYDGQWKGQITIREALGLSRNIPAIKAYFLAGEQDPIIALAEKMGITTLNPAHSYGYPLALGAGEVPLFEMVTAYGTFATNGKKPELTGIVRVENANGDILEEQQPPEFEEVMDPQVAFLINNILADKSASVGPRLFVNGRINAAKTGTSTKETKQAGSSVRTVRPSDAWVIGYSPSIVTGVWAGNTDGSGMAFNANGYATAGPAFNSVMTKALSSMPNEAFPQPEGIVHVNVSKASGLLPGPSTPEDMIISELFPSFSVPKEVENIFYEVKIDKISGLRATEYTPADAIETVIYQDYRPIANMLNWANEIRTYYRDKNETSPDNGNIRIGLPPTEYDNVHTPETAANAPSISIVTPAPQSRLPSGNFTVEVKVEAPNGVSRIEYYIDDEKEFFTTTSPYRGYLNVSRFFAEGSEHLVVAKVVDSLGYSSQSAIQIKVDNNSSDNSGGSPFINPNSSNNSSSSSNSSSNSSTNNASDTPAVLPESLTDVFIPN